MKRKLAEEVIVRLARVVMRLPYLYLNASFARTVSAVPRLRISHAAVLILQSLESHLQPSVRIAVARLLSNVSATDPDARDGCERLLADENRAVWVPAAIGLFRAGECPKAVWPAFALALKFKDLSAILSEFFESAEEGVFRQLESAMTSADEDERRAAEKLLVFSGRRERSTIEEPQPKQHAVDVHQLLRSEDRWDRFSGATRLIRERPGNEEAVQTLRGLLHPRESRLSSSAAEVLLRAGIHDELAFAILRSTVRGEIGYDRYCAIQTLERLGRVDQEDIAGFVLAIEPSGEAAANACRKLFHRIWPTRSEAESLRSLFAWQDMRDPHEDRDWLFGWIDRRAEELPRQTVV